ncbi:MAG: C-GCAxxG-C-C family protein [Clostridia bacterium]
MERDLAQEKAARARELFLSGYNCSQSVVAAFAPELGLSESVLLKLSSGFGGGMGCLRGTCGAVSGMCMVLSGLEGYDTPDDPAAKKRLYARVQSLVAEFTSEFGTTNCRELLALNGELAKSEPSERTPAYYLQRPCARYVSFAASRAKALDP